MSRIIYDYLRRWWLVYPLGAFMVGALATWGALDAGLLFTGFFMIPVVCELGRRPLGVMAALPVSRKTIALSYWGVAVALPVASMTAAIALVELLSRSPATPFQNVAIFLFRSLAIAGSSFCLFTFISPDDIGSDQDSYIMKLVWALLLPDIVFTFSGLAPLRPPTQNPIDYFWGLLGLFLTLLGYFRSEKLVFVRARKRLGGGSRSASKRIPNPAPGMARFGGVFFDIARGGFLFALIYSSVFFLMRTPGGENHFMWPMAIAFGTAGFASFLSSGMRMLRSLPLSSQQLALRLLLMPLAAILAMIAGAVAVEWLFLGHFLVPYSAIALMPIAGAVCISFSLVVRFGKDGHIIATGLAALSSMAIFGTVENTHWPLAFWWLLGLCLMVAAFFLNRHWLRSSYSYRPSTGGFLRRHR